MILLNKQVTTKISLFWILAIAYRTKSQQSQEEMILTTQCNQTFNKEIDLHVEDYKSFIDNKLSESNNSFVTEAGDVQKWVGGIDKDRALKAMEESINYLNSLKK